MAQMSAVIAELYGDAQRCAQSAGLVYVDADLPGISRVRRGKGFSYRSASGQVITDGHRKQYFADLAIPPAWRAVWICPSPDGHLLATGEDDRGRKQYLYHPKWRELRDLLNAYRLIGVGEQLPALRRHVAAQLRRRTLDRDRVIASMIRIMDLSGIRIGSELYADENDSVGLTTLTRRHAQVRGAGVEFDFPAKSGRRSQIVVEDAPVASVVTALLAQRHRRLFTVEGTAITATEVNQALGLRTDATMTAKDFRTWLGTRTAFDYLRANRGEDSEAVALAAVDAAAAQLHNTRAVARDHYVHPHLLTTVIDGSFAERLRTLQPRRARLRSSGEALLLAYLESLLADLAPVGTAA